MESLRIDTGAVTLSINNDENRTIIFYPTDVHFAEAFFNLVRDFMQHREDVSSQEEEIKASGFDKYYIDHTIGIWPPEFGLITFKMALIVVLFPAPF